MKGGKRQREWKGREMEGRERGIKYKTARVQRIAVLAYVSLCKCRDDIAKREKGLVYGLGFIQGQPLGISLVHLHKKTHYATSEPKHCCPNTDDISPNALKHHNPFYTRLPPPDHTDVRCTTFSDPARSTRQSFPNSVFLVSLFSCLMLMRKTA